MNRSRTIAAAALAGLALLVAGCGSDGGDEGSATTTTSDQGIRVGLVADAGQLNDDGFNELAYAGLKRAERELGIEGRVVEAKSAADYVPNMSTLARQGYDLVIGIGYAQSDAVAAAAEKYPDTKFAIVDFDQTQMKGTPANAQGLLFREEQVGYLVGYLGALSAKRAGGTSISAVGGYKEPPVDRFIAGYRAGAEAAVPGTKVQVGVLAGLGRPGQVQGARAQPDRGRVEGRVPGRRGLRSRARSRRRRTRACGGSASTATSRSSGRTCSRARSRESTRPCS